MNEITLLVADDHPLFRSGVRNELERIEHFQIIAEAGDGIEALKLIKEHKPDVAILDFEMPGLNGLEIASKVADLDFVTAIILLTMHRDRKIFYKAIDMGINGYVLKDDAITDIINAVKAVSAGRPFISDDLAEILIEKARSTQPDKDIADKINELTFAEKRVLNLVAELKSNQEIADLLFISKRTVENHKVNISSKLGLESSRKLLKFALQNRNLMN